MKKVILFIIISGFVGCKNREEKTPVKNSVESLSVSVSDLLKNVKDLKTKAETHIKLDTITDSTVKVLLIQYYKAGWMDGSNAVIDLHNSNTLSIKSVKNKQKSDWRKMENQVNSK